MKCPHCGYEHGWSSTKIENVSGDCGRFYSLSNSVVMARPRDCYADNETTPVFGCPSCHKLFMDI